jgi:hypothetical protein
MGSFRTLKRRRQREKSRAARWVPRGPHSGMDLGRLNDALVGRILPGIVDSFFRESPLMAMLKSR